MSEENYVSGDSVSDAANNARAEHAKRSKNAAEIYQNISHEIDLVVAQRKDSFSPAFGVDDYVIRPLQQEISVSFRDAVEGSRATKINNQSHVITISPEEAVVVTNTNGIEVEHTIIIADLDVQDATMRILQSIPQVNHP